jgi:hypothetical protein
VGLKEGTQNGRSHQLIFLLKDTINSSEVIQNLITQDFSPYAITLLIIMPKHLTNDT